MEDATTNCAAFDETVVFLSHFKDLKDPRQQGKIIYPLDEILLLCLLAVLAGAETFVDIALFGCKKRELLRRFRPFKDGTPAHDHLGDILAVLDAEQFQHCFVAWVAALSGAPEGVIAIDGKTSRRSGRKKHATPAIHMVSAFAARQRLVLGQVKVGEKSNEIIAIPKLLDMLAIEGATLADVVKTTLYLVDMADFAAVNEVWVEYFTDDRPTRSAVAVAALPIGARVEVEAWAYAPVV